MTAKRINITDVFEAKLCHLCGSKELSQFYGINENFIEYCGVYYPFRELLVECLNISITKEKGESMEMCLECKEKVLSFYHFKRKIKDVQDSLYQCNTVNNTSLQNTQKPNKIVYNIYKIIENFTEIERCSISSIRVDKKERKLIIEASDENLPRNRKSTLNDDDQDVFAESPIIKHEPLCESNFFNESESYDNLEETTTSKEPEPVKKKRKTERKRKDEQEIGQLDLSVGDVINAFNADTNKFNDKYGDVFRKLMLENYQTRIVVNFSFIGKSGLRVTVRCEKCKENYKIVGCRDDFVNKVATRCTIWSSKIDFCRCGYEKPNQMEHKSRHNMT